MVPVITVSIASRKTKIIPSPRLNNFEYIFKFQKEVDLLIIRLGATEGEPTDVSTAVGLAVTNVICSILMSVRFKPEDERYQRFNSLIEEGFILFGSLSFVNFIPVFRYLPWLRRVRDKLSQNREEMAGFFQETIDQHKATFNNNEARDLVDTYLQEIMKAKAEGRESELFQGKDHGSYSEIQKLYL